MEKSKDKFCRDNFCPACCIRIDKVKSSHCVNAVVGWISATALPSRHSRELTDRTSPHVLKLLWVRKIIIVQKFNHLIPLFMFHSRGDRLQLSYRCSINADMSIDEMFFPEHLELRIFNTNTPCTMLLNFIKTLCQVYVFNSYLDNNEKLRSKVYFII